jgi:hypothetical protein
MAVTSTKSRRFDPLSLDAVNFLLSDVRGALGPYLNVFLVTQQHWSQSEVGLVTTISGLLGLAVQTPIGARSGQREGRDTLRAVECVRKLVEMDRCAWQGIWDRETLSR